MADTLGTRFKNAWNAFMNRDPTRGGESYVNSSYYRPDRVRLTGGNERSIITSIYNRIAVDVAAIKIEHVRLDENKRYLETLDTDFNECLTLSANLDQTGRAFRQDAVMTLLDEGCIAIVPFHTSVDPNYNASYKIYEMRVGTVTAWMPDKVRIKLYDQNSGQKKEIVMSKRAVAIVENPFYSIMNEPNSTMSRLKRKLALLDAFDDYSASGKLDIIIQLPYAIKSELRKKEADKRRAELENQLASAKYGVAYIDGTEHITQLNRPVENNLLTQIQYLTDELLSQLGITMEILNGTADEKAMINYQNRIVEPILSAITDSMKRTFLTKTARSERQSILFFTEPFKLLAPSQLAELADKFTRNEIMSSNEVRQIAGLKPSQDPEADQLRNKNLNPTDGSSYAGVPGTDSGGPAVSDPNGQMMAPEEQVPTNQAVDFGSIPISELMK